MFDIISVLLLLVPWLSIYMTICVEQSLFSEANSH